MAAPPPPHPGHQPPPTLTHLHPLPGHPPHPLPARVARSSQAQGATEPSTMLDIIDTAERTIGFKPIHKSDLAEICRIHNINDEQEGMKLLIMEYLKFEMKNSVTLPENIVRVFPPSKPEWDTLYAEFDTTATTSTVYRYTRFLRDNHLKVFMYVPHMFYGQFNHLSNIAHKYRLPPSSHKTRIKFGRENMYLQVKAPGAHVWQVVQVHNLPPLSSQHHSPELDVSPTPAPGRNRENGNKRAASTSPQSLRSMKAHKPNASAEVLVDVEIDDAAESLHPTVDTVVPLVTDPGQSQPSFLA